MHNKPSTFMGLLAEALAVTDQATWERVQDMPPSQLFPEIDRVFGFTGMGCVGQSSDESLAAGRLIGLLIRFTEDARLGREVREILERGELFRDNPGIRDLFASCLSIDNKN